MKIPMHRFKYTKLTSEQIGKKLAPTVAGPRFFSEYSGALAGKSLKIVTDNGPVLNYRFNDGIAALAQGQLHHLAQPLFVVNNQNFFHFNPA